MSETIEQGGSLSKWDEELAKHARQAASNFRPNITNISIRGGIMTLNGVEIPGNEIPAIIVTANHEKQYYDPDIPFDPSNLQQPICFAQSLDGQDMHPHELSRKPQALKCDACEMAKFRRNAQGKVKASPCKTKFKLALMPGANLADVESIQKSEIALLSIPATSTKNFSEYVSFLLTEHKRPAFSVLTNVKASRHPKFQIEVTFGLAALVERNFVSAIMDRIAPCEDLLMKPYEGTPDDPTKPTSENKNKKY